MTRADIVAQIHRAIDAGDTKTANCARAKLRALDVGKQILAQANTMPAGKYRPSCNYGVEQDA